MGSLAAPERLGAGGLLARLVAALVLVYATFNPEGYSYVHWAMIPIFRGGGFGPVQLLAGIVLLIGWVVFLQATSRALGVWGIVLVLSLFGALTWLLVDWKVLEPTGSKGIAHIALVIVALVLAIGMSWSHMTRRLTGQVDTDRVN